MCYQTFGNPAADPLLLVMGLGGPMIWWDEGCAGCSPLAGFFVIRYDNRDTGRSSRIRGARSPAGMLVRAFPGRSRPDAVLARRTSRPTGSGLLDHLGLGSAHVVGVSMGGMIAQTMAHRAPGRRCGP